MIDTQSRTKLFQKQTNDKLLEGIQKVEEAVNKKQFIVSENPRKESLDGIKHFQILDQLKKVESAVATNKIDRSLVDDISKLVKISENTIKAIYETKPESKPVDFEPIKKKIDSLKINLPEVFEIAGDVNVANFPKHQTVSVDNLDMLSKQVMEISNGLTMIFKEISKNPKSSIPESFGIKGWHELIDALEEVKKGLNIIINKDDSLNKGPMEVNIANFPPQMVPQPVTNVNVGNITGTVSLPTGASTSDNQINGNQLSKVKETAPTDSSKTNPSLGLSYDANGNLTGLTMTIGGTSYNKTLTWTSGNLTNISSWS